MTMALISSLAGLALSLVGFLILVREVRYAHLTEFHNLNIEEALRKIEHWQGMTGQMLRESSESNFGKTMVYIFGPIPDEEWNKSAVELKAQYAPELKRQLEEAKRWKRTVPAAALKKRMGWLTIGATLVVVGVLLQATSSILQAMPSA